MSSSINFQKYKADILSITGECCENCSHYGGLMCDHVDEYYQCLGWEPIDWEQRELEYKKFEEIIDKIIKIPLN